MKFDIANQKLAAKGKTRIELAGRQMDVLGRIQARFKRQKPLKGLRVAACLHVTAETANLMKTLVAGGAKLVLTASNPLSTQDDVAASLVVHDRIAVYAKKGENRQTYFRHINTALDFNPHITMDDGADLVSTLHRSLASPTHTILSST